MRRLLRSWRKKISCRHSSALARITFGVVGKVIHLGSVGILRASHREIDASKSIHPQFPFHPHKKQEKIPPGTIVKLEICIWAMGVDFDGGESISVKICGQYPSIVEYKTFSKPRPELELNRERHTIHCSEEYPSCVILQFI